MLVYRDQRSHADPRAVLARLCATGHCNLSNSDPHSAAIEYLIEVGILESAVSDALFLECDGIDPLAQAFRRASLAAGHAVWHTWQNSPGGAREWRQRSLAELEGIEPVQLPRSVELSVPEGYAYYGVYPELYLEAAREYRSSSTEKRVVCLGLRSIGSSLSAVVAAALEELGCEIESWTLRPRGHPFCREHRLSPELRRRLEHAGDARFIIVDEGPGISGSSFAGTVAMLRSLAIEEDRIVLFPSWDSDGSTLRSREARQLWSSYRRFSRTFEQVWLESGRLARAFPGRWQDFSAGQWRQALYTCSELYPAVQPQHERRKYLVESENGSATLLSFIGWGEGARAKVRRGQRIADAGFTPRPEIAAHGFQRRPFVSGCPVTQVGETDPAFLEKLAQYLAYLSCEHQTDPTVSESALTEMAAVNLEEGAPDLLRPGMARLRELCAERSVALDGRMFPHEWIQTSTGYLKVDAIDHHDDHFFPGCQDVGWDLAAAMLELGLDRAARHFLLDRYRHRSGDQTIMQRLPAYAVAYLAFRLGYATLAAEVLGKSEDGRRFASERRRYRRLLREQLSGSSPSYWNV